MMYRAFLVLLVGVLTTGCRFFETQTSPSNTTTEPTTVSLSGVVRAAGTRLPSRARQSRFSMAPTGAAS